MSMTESLKQRWIKALQSGEYPKGKYELVTNEGCYCCLGVLGRICGLDHAQLKGRASKAGHGTMLSDEVLNLVGLPLPVAVSLAAHNDASTSFNDVIPYIESFVLTDDEKGADNI